MGAKGFDELDSITGSVLIPVYAIGGIDTDNASLMKSHNVRGICLRSAFMTADEPAELVKRLRISTS
jgi:thiamine-phosphate pyrophosphorylase